MADFISAVTWLLPSWIIFSLALLTFMHRIYVSCRWPWVIISRQENVLYAIALFWVTLFYAGITWGWWESSLAIALSRLVWAWLLVAALYISHRMAKRHRSDGME